MISGYKFLVQPKTIKQIKLLPTNRILESRMALKLDDLIGKKKEVAQVLDLSKALANNAEDFKKIMEKVPEYKMKAEKVKPEEAKSYDFSRKGRKKRVKPTTTYPFADPLPEEMRSIRLDDLCPVNIQWNMLTTLRPKSKADTEYFSRNRGKFDSNKLENEKPLRRLVELGKLQIATQDKEKRLPDSSFMRKMKNRAGITESRYISCSECGEDFCQKEACTKFQYENFRREPMTETIIKKEPEEKRGRSLTKTRNKKPKTRSKSNRKSSDRTSKARARSNGRGKGSNGAGAASNSGTGKKKSGRSKSRSPSKSKSKVKKTSGKEENQELKKKIKKKGSPLNKKNAKVTS